MRGILLLVLMAYAAAPALAGEVQDRLDRLEYDARIQRADTDMLVRQRALESIDAIDRANHVREQALIDRLEDVPVYGRSETVPRR
jgi:hypothetical protein